MTFPIQSKERSELEAEVIEMVKRLSRDELRCIRYWGNRMIRIGHSKYGPLDIENDDRRWVTERTEETADREFYGALIELAKEDRRKERLRCFVHDEAYARVSEAMEPLKGVE